MSKREYYIKKKDFQRDLLSAATCENVFLVFYNINEVTTKTKHISLGNKYTFLELYTFKAYFICNLWLKMKRKTENYQN